MIRTGNGNDVQKVDLPGGVKGAFWTLTAAQLANLLQNGGLGNFLGNLTGCGGGNVAAMLPMLAQMVSNGSCCHGATDKERAELLAQIATLQAEKYSDNAAKQESDRLLTQWLKPYGDEIADARVREARLEGRVECMEKTQRLEMDIIKKDIQLAKQEAACCCAANATAIANVAATLNKITEISVPNSVLNPGIPAVEVVHTTTTTAGA